MAEVVKTNVSSNEISSEIDLGLDKVPKSFRAKVQRDVGEYLVEQTLLSLSDRKSPVSKANYTSRLTSKAYKKFKESEGRSGVADLEFEGDLKDSLRFKKTDKGIKIGHFNASQAPKADGHNNFSGDSKLPERRYLPLEGEKYKRNIQREIDRIIADSLLEQKPVSEQKLRSVTSKQQFWELLESTYGALSRPEIRTAVQRNEGFFQLLTTLDLVKWLR